MHVAVAEADAYRAVFELNVISVLVAMQAVIPVMRAQGGGVISYSVPPVIVADCGARVLLIAEAG